MFSQINQVDEVFYLINYLLLKISKKLVFKLFSIDKYIVIASFIIRMVDFYHFSLNLYFYFSIHFYLIPNYINHYY